MQAEAERRDLPRMVMIDGQLYSDTGKPSDFKFDRLLLQGATFNLSNQTDEIYTYGEAYSLQTLKENTWEAVPYIIENWGFNDIGYELLAQTVSEEITIDWTWLYGELPDGTYKLTKAVTNQGETHEISNEFEIVGSEKIKISSYTLVE